MNKQIEKIRSPSYAYELDTPIKKTANKWDPRSIENEKKYNFKKYKNGPQPQTST
jgi:hypothetical protein